MSFAEFISIIALGIQGVLVYLAWKTIQENNGSAKKRAIVDLIIKQREDLALREASSIIYDLNRQDDGFIRLFDEPDRMQKVLYALDSLEFVAVGIRLGAFDEGVYKDLQCSKVRNTWKAASGFIMEVRRRKDLPTLYQDLEHLACKWDADPIKELKIETYRHTK